MLQTFRLRCFNAFPATGRYLRRPQHVFQIATSDWKTINIPGALYTHHARLLCTSTSTRDAATTFYNPKTTRGMNRLVASTEARLAAGSRLAVASCRPTPSVLGAAVAKGGACAGETVGASAGSISGNLFSSGRGRSCLGGSRSCLGGGSLGGWSCSLGNRRTAACTEARLAARTTVIGGASAISVLGTTVPEGGAKAGLLAGASTSTISRDLSSGGGGSRCLHGGDSDSRCLHGGGSRLSGAGGGLGGRGDSTVATTVTEARLATGSAVIGGAPTIIVLRTTVPERGAKAGGSSSRTTHTIGGNLLCGSGSSAS